MLLDDNQSLIVSPAFKLMEKVKDTIALLIPRKGEVPTENQINVPQYLREYCHDRLHAWVENAFLARRMQLGREYIIQGSEIWPVDYQSTGVTETNKKWSDGLQQFIRNETLPPCFFVISDY